MENNLALYYTHNKDNQKMNKKPYIIKGVTEIRVDNNGKDVRCVWLTAVDAKTQRTIAHCDFYIINGSAVCTLAQIKILDHHYDHCGIGTKLIKTMENFAITHGVESIMGICDQVNDSYKGIRENFYLKNTYLLSCGFWLVKDKRVGNLNYHHDIVEPQYIDKTNTIVCDNQDDKDTNENIKELKK